MNVSQARKEGFVVCVCPKRSTENGAEEQSTEKRTRPGRCRGENKRDAAEREGKKRKKEKKPRGAAKRGKLCRSSGFKGGEKPVGGARTAILQRCSRSVMHQSRTKKRPQKRESDGEKTEGNDCGSPSVNVVHGAADARAAGRAACAIGRRQWEDASRSLGGPRKKAMRRRSMKG